MYYIDDFINEVQQALNSWIESHGLDSWLDNESYNGLKNAMDYILKAAQEDIADDIYTDGMFYCGCGWLGDGYEVLDYNRCPNCGLFTAKYDMDMCIEWAEELYYDIDQIDVDSLPGYVMKSAYNKWIAEEFPQIPELMDDAKEALDQIDNANDPAELLSSLLMACHCCHVSGVIVNDYGDISFDLIDRISNQGLESVFGTDEVADYLGI